MGDNKNSVSKFQLNNSSTYKFMKKVENKLNGEIGFNWWKRYIAASIWDNISTPINLMITLLTAVTTAQVNTNNFISEGTASTITIITLLISTLNTFFRPHAKVNINLEIMNKYAEFGNRFEEIYYSQCNDDDHCRIRLEQYKLLLLEINKYGVIHPIDSVNFFSDFIHITMRYTCLRSKEKWLDLDKEFEEIV